MNAGAEATGGMEFGLSNESPIIILNSTCSGNEYSFSDCPGYELDDALGDYCPSGNYQAGVRCIEGEATAYKCILHL